MGSKVVSSSDSSIVSAASQWNASIKSYSINVSNLAAVQKNTGSAFSGDDKSVVGTGLNIFKIKSGTVERNISVAISSSDTNKTAFAKLASAINNSYAGIKATVATDTDNKTYLMLESSKTGAKNAFTITDLQGNAISATGLGNVADKAQNAVYSVDGKQFSSSSNTVALDNGKVQATLKEKGEATIAVVPDAASSSLPDFYTYSSSLFSSGGYFSSLIRGTMFDMLL